MNKFLLCNRVVIVTGASFGIGEAITKLFTKNGAKVVLAAGGRGQELTAGGFCGICGGESTGSGRERAGRSLRS